jgi:hypothetical protein
MPGIAQTLPVPPKSVYKMQMWNAIRVAFVNRNHAGAITYDSLTTPPPKVNLMTMLNAVRLAAGGQLQS